MPLRASRVVPLAGALHLWRVSTLDQNAAQWRAYSYVDELAAPPLVERNAALVLHYCTPNVPPFRRNCQRSAPDRRPIPGGTESRQQLCYLIEPRLLKFKNWAIFSR